MWRSFGRVCLSQMSGCLNSTTQKSSILDGGRNLVTDHGTTTTSCKVYGKVHDFISSKIKNGDEESNKKDSSTNQDVPRTIIVKRGDLTSSLTTTPPAKLAVGKLKQRFPLERQLRDSQGKLIWIPASPYPIVRANALLDSPTYLRSAGESIAGTDAARRLLHGKKDLFVLLRYVKRPVLLQGHGIPSQVLEYILMNALELLDSTNHANVLRWVQTNDETTRDQVLAEWCVENLKTLLVDGELETTMSDLYFENAQDLLLLYWTVMDRIIKRLCFKRVPIAWNVEFRRKRSTTRLALIMDYQITDASVTLKGQQAELFFQAMF